MPIRNNGLVQHSIISPIMLKLFSIIFQTYPARGAIVAANVTNLTANSQ